MREVNYTTHQSWGVEDGPLLTDREHSHRVRCLSRVLGGLWTGPSKKKNHILVQPPLEHESRYSCLILYREQNTFRGFGCPPFRLRVPQPIPH